MAARKPSVIYQMKCALYRFVTFYTTHVLVFSSHSSLFFSFWNCEMHLLPFFSLFRTIHAKFMNFCFAWSLSDLFYWIVVIHKSNKAKKKLEFCFHQPIFCLSIARSYIISFMDAVLWNLLSLYYFQAEEYCVLLKYVNLYFWQKLYSLIYAQEPRQRHYLGIRITILTIFITNHTIYIECDVSVVL